MPALSLSQLARNACVRNIRMIYDVGDCPYPNVKSLLRRVDNPEQLHQIELNSPQICKHDAEIWKILMDRDIPNWEIKQPQPDASEGWFDFYNRLFNQSREDIAREAKAMKVSMDDLKAKQAERTSKRVELSGVKLPNGLKREGDVIKMPRSSGVFAKEPAGSKSMRPQMRAGGWEAGVYESRNEPREPRTRRRGPTTTTEQGPKSTAPKSKLAPFRKEVMAKKLFPSKDKSGLLSTAYPKPMQSKIQAAPNSMLHDYQQKASVRSAPSVGSLAEIVHTRKRSREDAGLLETTDELVVREKRLKALQTPPRRPRLPSPQLGIVRPPKIHRRDQDAIPLLERQTKYHLENGGEDSPQAKVFAPETNKPSALAPESQSHGLSVSDGSSNGLDPRPATPIGRISPQMRPKKKAAKIFMPTKKKQRVS